ncbi:MAG: FlgD immunoglobulin-like domain containing protein [Candidatus Eisenbacteria bacterium]
MTNLSIAIQNSVLSEASHGLALFGLSNPAITNVAINNCSSTPVLMSVSANPSYSGVTFTANAVTAVGIQGEDIAVNSTLPVRNVGGFTNITYYLMNGALHMLSGATLTVAPGVVIKNQLNGGGLVIDGGLIADGTPALPIVFTSERDDLFGNPADTNGDGAISAPAQANWSYIHFTATTNDAVSMMDNCRITYASFGPFDGYNPALWITSAAPPITSTLISKATYGIRVDGDAAPLIAACDINNCGSAPIVMSVQSDPNIATTNVYSTNVFNAIALMAETMSQSATLKYRPGVGTPTFAYLPTGTITIPSGVTLSIQPQVVLKPSSSFAVFQVNGALNCVGSNATTGRVVFSSRRDDNPIYGGDTTPNDSSTPQAGDWGYIQFNDTAVDPACLLRNILFQFGSTNQSLGVVSALSANPTLARLEFFQNGTAMTFGGSSSARAESVTVLNCTLLPITQSLVANPTYSNITLANNQYTALGLLGETIAQDVRTPVRSLGIYNNIQYALEGNVSIAFGAKWTIDPGVVLKMGRIFNDPLGSSITIDGALVARGKPDSLIVFTASPDDLFGQDMRSDGALTAPAAGQWGSISFSGISNDTATVLQHCRFRYGGSGGAALRFTNSGQSLSNCIMTLSAGSAVSIEGNSTPSFTNCQFDSSTNAPVTMSLVSEPVFTNVQFLGNFYTALGVIGEAIAQDVLWKIRAVAGRNNMPYLLQSALTIGLGATLTMQPGVIVKSFSGGSILVQRAMQSEGRTDSLVVFTSYRDDFYGGDTNNDGALTSPTASDWNYITIDGTAIDPQVRFRNTVFRYGGSGTTQGALRCVNSSPSVDSCLFSFNAVGISIEGASNPLIHGSSFFGNTQFAVNNTGNSFCANAEGNWWGAVNGPNDASSTADLCGLGLNAGSGDKVSNNVDYLPFATSGIQNPLLGDVSLNGQVLAFDASLVLQSVVSAIVLSPLQQLVADVSGAGGVSAFDATLILRYAAGVIRAFPAAANGVRQAHPDAASALSWQRASQAGTATLRLGVPERTPDGWQVPVVTEGTQQVYAVEFALAGAPTAGLSEVSPTRTGTLYAHGTQGSLTRVALAALEAMAPGTVALLRFPPEANPAHLTLIEARINESQLGSELVEPGTTLLAAPAPNPAAGPVSIRFALGTKEHGQSVRVVVVDLAGRLVRQLHDGPVPAGTRSFDWDLRDARGLPAQPGLYFIRASAGPWQASRRLTIVR